MRRFLPSLALLSAALVVAGCGSSSNNPPPPPNSPTNASLSGQYAFQEQVYTYYAGGLPLKAGAAASADSRFRQSKVLQHVTALPHIAEREAAMQAHAPLVRHNSFAKSRHTIPEQGEQYNTNVAWGGSAGSLTFDGKGNVTAGEIDFNEPLAGYFVTDQVTGTYTVNSDQTAVLNVQGVSSGNNYNFFITLQGTTNGSVASGAQLLEGVSDSSGNAEIGTGQMLQQSGGLAQNTLSGNYVFGVQGQTCYGCPQTTSGDLIAAGVLSANGSGSFGSGGEADISTGFLTDNQVGVTGTYTAPDSQGRLNATLATSGYANGALPASYVIYLVNSSTAFILSADQSTATTAAALLYGNLGLQSGSLSNASLTGNYVLAETTEDLANETVSPDTYADTYLALLTANGGALNGTGDENLAGTINSGVAFNYGTYTVAANGRATFSGTTPSGAAAPVFYMQSGSFGYGVDQLFGAMLQEPGLLSLYQQTGSGFANSSLNGIFALGTLPAATSNVGLDANANLVGPGILNGALSFDGNGNVSGDGASAYLLPGAQGTGSLSGTYALSANGRGTITGSSSSSALFGNEVLYAISGSQALSMDVTPGNSASSIQIEQK